MYCGSSAADSDAGQIDRKIYIKLTMMRY